MRVVVVAVATATRRYWKLMNIDLYLPGFDDSPFTSIWPRAQS